MFNYASLVGIAKRNNMTAILPKDMPLRDYFLANVSIGDVQHSMNLVLHHVEFGRRACAYDFQTEHLWREYPYEWVLHGYYQSWMYVTNVEHELRTQHFVFKEDVMNKANGFYKDIVPKRLQDPSVIRVGVHIRRSDHMSPEKVNFGYTVADKPYIEQAMKYFRDKYPKLVFIVCSEDHTWFKEEIGDSKTIPDVIFSVGNSPAVDMAILSQCNHSIITVGSFGWWGAWLANGTTIYYNKWPRYASLLEYHTDKKQYFPSHWIPMPA